MASRTTPSASLHPILLRVPHEVQSAKGRTKVQALSQLARLATQRSAHRALGQPLTGFPKDDDGVPQPIEGVHWSLSHKSALVAGIVAEHPIGIDVEFHRPVKSGMHTRIATAEEWRLGQTADADVAAGEQPPERLFYRFWTGKEAVLKAVGQGLVGLRNCRITALPSSQQMRLTYLDTPWEVVQRWYDNHLVAVAYPSDTPSPSSASCQNTLAPGSIEIHWPKVGTLASP